jgi:hypothetical protein
MPPSTTPHINILVLYSRRCLTRTFF